MVSHNAHIDTYFDLLCLQACHILCDPRKASPPSGQLGSCLSYLSTCGLNLGDHDMDQNPSPHIIIVPDIGILEDEDTNLLLKRLLNQENKYKIEERLYLRDQRITT
jgi:hypothetical protein